MLAKQVEETGDWQIMFEFTKQGKMVLKREATDMGRAKVKELIRKVHKVRFSVLGGIMTADINQGLIATAAATQAIPSKA